MRIAFTGKAALVVHERGSDPKLETVFVASNAEGVRAAVMLSDKQMGS
jgi:hypothetical protein